jgi:hypothetical protein
MQNKNPSEKKVILQFFQYKICSFLLEIFHEMLKSHEFDLSSSKIMMNELQSNISMSSAHKHPGLRTKKPTETVAIYVYSYDELIRLDGSINQLM